LQGRPYLFPSILDRGSSVRRYLSMFQAVQTVLIILILFQRAQPIPCARSRNIVTSGDSDQGGASSVQLMAAAAIWRPKPTISRGIFSDSAA